MVAINVLDMVMLKVINLMLVMIIFSESWLVSLVYLLIFTLFVNFNIEAAAY